MPTMGTFLQTVKRYMPEIPQKISVPAGYLTTYLELTNEMQ